MSIPPSRMLFGVIPLYGLLIVLGAAIAVFLADRESRRLCLPCDTIIDLALCVLPFGILGARLYYVAFSWDTFRGHPLSVLYIWEGGLAIYGGLIAGLLTVVLFCRKRDLSVLTVLDLLVPGVALAQGIGRWGNYFNQEAYGLLLRDDHPFAFFPLAVQIPSGSGLEWHVAAFFLESVWDFLIFVFLMWGRRKLFRRRGDVLFWYLLTYGAGRLVIENLRMDSLYLGSSIRVSQLLSVLLCVFILLMFYRRNPLKHRPLPLFSLILTLVFGFVTLLFSLNVLPFVISEREQCAGLSLFLLTLLFAGIVLYGRDNTGEVIYAHQKAD